MLNFVYFVDYPFKEFKGIYMISDPNSAYGCLRDDRFNNVANNLYDGVLIGIYDRLEHKIIGEKFNKIIEKSLAFKRKLKKENNMDIGIFLFDIALANNKFKVEEEFNLRDPIFMFYVKGQSKGYSYQRF
jgi:hypothetical protein